MPNFQYQSLTMTGQTRTGTLTANDRVDAVRQLVARGETATKVTAADGEVAAMPAHARNGTAHAAAPKETASWTKITLFNRSKPSLRKIEMANLMRELATALEAGLPLMQSLKTVRKQASGRGMPVILDYMIERVERGDSLHQAAKDYGAPFDDMIVGMLRAADASGEMNKILHQLADLLERSVELRREVMGAVFYPMIVATLIAGSIVVLVTVLVPTLIVPLTEQKSFQMPFPTAVLLSFATIIGSYWIYGIALAVLLFFGWRMWSAVPENRYKVDRFVLRIPVVGRLMRDVAVARFTRTLGTLSSAGLPILDSLRITSGTLGNKALERAVEQVQEQVAGGKSLADPLERSGLFPPLLVQVVNLGERSGRLESMLLHAAVAFDRQVGASLKLLTKALPPVLLIVMALAAGFVLAGILLPLLELQSLVNA